MPPRVNPGELLSGVPAIPELVTQTLAVHLMAKQVSSSMKSLEK